MVKHPVRDPRGFLFKKTVKSRWRTSMILLHLWWKIFSFWPGSCSFSIIQITLWAICFGSRYFYSFNGMKWHNVKAHYQTGMQKQHRPIVEICLCKNCKEEGKNHIYTWRSLLPTERHWGDLDTYKTVNFNEIFKFTKNIQMKQHTSYFIFLEILTVQTVLTSPNINGTRSLSIGVYEY